MTIYDKLPAAKTGTMAASKNNKSREDEYLPIETEYMPLVSNGELTLLKIHLITGRSHHILQAFHIRWLETISTAMKHLTDI